MRRNCVTHFKYTSFVQHFLPYNFTARNDSPTEISNWVSLHPCRNINFKLSTEENERIPINIGILHVNKVSLLPTPFYGPLFHIKSIQIHDFSPCRNKIFYKFLFSISTCINFSKGSQFRIGAKY